MNLTVKTFFPTCNDSPEYFYPWGVLRDMTTCKPFWKEIESYFNNKNISYLDCGCAGGFLVKEALEKGYTSIGLEGVPYWIDKLDLDNPIAKNWKQYYNKNIFLADITKPFFIFNDDIFHSFDLITAFEVIEHLLPNKIHVFFNNILNHLSKDGIFLGTISTISEKSSGAELHNSLHTYDEWIYLLNQYFLVESYPLQYCPRNEPNSFRICLRHK